MRESRWLIALVAVVVGCSPAVSSGTGEDGRTGMPPAMGEADGATPAPGRSDPDDGSFSASVTTDRDSYEAGTDVRFTVELCWHGAQPTVTDSGGGTDILHGFRVVNEDGEVVADDRHVVRTLELRRVTWRPGQCRSEERVGDQHYWNREGANEPEALGEAGAGRSGPGRALRDRGHRAPGRTRTFRAVRDPARLVT